MELVSEKILNLNLNFFLNILIQNSQSKIDVLFQLSKILSSKLGMSQTIRGKVIFYK